MKAAFFVKLENSIEHEGELFDEIKFRDILAQDIEEGFISLNELMNVNEDDVDHIIKAGAKIAKTLSIKPKLGEKASQLPLNVITQIIKEFGEHQKALHQGKREDENTPDPLSLSQD